MFFFQCVFVDSTNKKLFYTSDNGRTIHRSDLSFHPSELAFDEEFPDKYVILDKIDSNRKVRTVYLFKFCLGGLLHFDRDFLINWPNLACLL